MELYAYSIDKIFLKRDSNTMKGKITDMATGYIFVDSQDEAVKILESKYVSNENETYDIHLEKTNIIPM